MTKTILTIATAALIAASGLSGANAAQMTDSAGQHEHAGRTLRPRAPSKPVAYGYVSSAGTVDSGTGNFTAAWNSSAGWYAIAITGVNYYYSSFTTNLTTTLPAGVICQTDSVGGQLLVICRNSAGAAVQADFQFLTF